MLVPVLVHCSNFSISVHANSIQFLVNQVLLYRTIYCHNYYRIRQKKRRRKRNYCINLFYFINSNLQRFLEEVMKIKIKVKTEQQHNRKKKIIYFKTSFIIQLNMAMQSRRDFLRFLFSWLHIFNWFLRNGMENILLFSNHKVQFFYVSGFQYRTIYPFANVFLCSQMLHSSKPTKQSIKEIQNLLVVTVCLTTQYTAYTWDCNASEEATDCFLNWRSLNSFRLLYVFSLFLFCCL